MSRSRVFAACFALFLLATDRLLKHYFLLNPSPLLRGEVFFNLSLYKNAGLVFSLPLPLPRLMTVLVSIIIIILIKLLIDSWRTRDEKILDLLLMIAGASSNLFDRLAHGFVIDYLAFFGRSFINLADLMIAAGVIRLILKEIRTK